MTCPMSNICDDIQLGLFVQIVIGVEVLCMVSVSVLHRCKVMVMKTVDDDFPPLFIFEVACGVKLEGLSVFEL